MITLSENAGNLDNAALHKIIEAEIAQVGGWITFARFMELALYAPDEGYYTSRVGLIGAKGDFYTAPHLTPVFGQLLARQIVGFWQRLGQPADFQLVEMGAGQGLIASDILSELYKNEKILWSKLRYVIVERSTALREGQKRRLKAVPNGEALLEKVSWRDLSDFGPESVTGCFISNELVDAFPVHLIQLENGEWREVYVGLNAVGDFEEEPGPLSIPALKSYFELSGLDPAKYEEGYRTEINLAALDWLQAVARTLGRGYALTIDYGYLAEKRYHPKRREGTLQTYNGHRVGVNPYVNLGHQDITAHVDFTALLKTGEAVGLKTEGFTTQAAFLASLGLGELMLNLTTPGAQPGRSPKAIMTEHEALKRLINPAEMGNFGVLIQSKAVADNPTRLSGLTFTM